METCWSEICQIENELEAQNPEKLIWFIQHLARKKLLTRYMLRGLIEGTAYPHNLWNEAHSVFKVFPIID